MTPRETQGKPKLANAASDVNTWSAAAPVMPFRHAGYSRSQGLPSCLPSFDPIAAAVGRLQPSEPGDVNRHLHQLFLEDRDPKGFAGKAQGSDVGR